MAEKNPLKAFLASNSQTPGSAPAEAAKARKMATKAVKTPSRKTTKATAPAMEAMPLTHPDHDPVYDAKINFFVTKDMERALKVGAVDAGLSVAALLRGMIDLWQEGAPDAEGKTSRERRSVEIRARKHHRR